MTRSARGITAYLLITFGLAWAIWGVLLARGVPLLSPTFQIAGLPAAFAPAIAAFIVRKWITREGFADAGLKLNLRKWRYYLVAQFLPLIVSLVIIALAWLLGFGRPDPTGARFFDMVGSFVGGAKPQIPNLLFILPVQFLISPLFASPLLFGEEFGWRGYLQPRLLGDKPLAAAVATGVLWGVWHYPINWRGYNFPEHPVLGLFVFPVGTVLLSIIFGWLKLKTGSIWSACLAHAATNATGGSLLLILFWGRADMIWVSYVGVLGWIPLGLLCAWILLTGQLDPGRKPTDGPRFQLETSPHRT